MKLKLALLGMAAVLSTAAMAQSNTVSKTIDGPAVKELHVIGPVIVELVEAENVSVKAEGSYQFVNSVSINWSKDNLYISYPDHIPAGNNILKVNVKNLKSIVAEEGAKIVTQQPLKSQNLVVTVRDDSQAKVMNYGKIRVNNYGDVRISKYAYKAY